MGDSRTLRFKQGLAYRRPTHRVANGIAHAYYRAIPIGSVQHFWVRFSKSSRMKIGQRLSSFLYPASTVCFTPMKTDGWML